MLQILSEDEFLIVLDKPPATLSMGRSAEERSILSSLYAHLSVETEARTSKPQSSHSPSIREANEPREPIGSQSSTDRPFVAMIGRLDFPVSGLLLVAKRREAAEFLWHQQRTGQISKSYLAIVQGQVRPTSGVMSHWLTRSKRLRRVSISDQQTLGSQLAQLRYRVAQSSPQWSLVHVRLITGRKHQIRAQFSHQGHPILGDYKYGSRDVFPQGIALTCQRLSYIHPLSLTRCRHTLSICPTWKEAVASRFE